jgi:hypothetical protein
MAYWAETYDRAVEILESVPELLFLQISADEHHQARIPFNRVKNAVRAAQKLKLVYQVAICTDNEESPGCKKIVNPLLEIMEKEQITTVITLPYGRASLLKGKMAYRMTDIPPAGACGARLRRDISGQQVVSCIGPIIDITEKHPLLLGNLHDTSLKEILDTTETNAVLHFIRTWGPSKIYELLKEQGCEARLPDTFVEGNICILCRDLMADPTLRKGIVNLFEDNDLVEAVAYGRAHYLKEPEMAQRLGIAALSQGELFS